MRYLYMTFVTSVAACHADELPPLLWDGEHVRLGTTSEQSPCEGSVAYIDAYIETLDRKYGDFTELDLDLEYYWIPDFDDFQRLAPCDGDTECVVDSSVFSHSLPREHEIVHAVFGVEFGPPFFREGLAEALGGVPTASFVAGEIGDQVFASTFRDVDYGDAGSFVAFLDRTYGPESLMDFISSLDPSPNESQIEEEALRVYDLSFVGLVGEFAEASPHCFTQLMPCEGVPATPWDDANTWKASGDLACSQDAVGPTDPPRSWIPASGAESWQLHVVELEDETYDLGYFGDPDSLVFAELYPCGECEVRLDTPENGGVERPENGGPFQAKKGRYYLFVWQEGQEGPQPYDIRLSR